MSNPRYSARLSEDMLTQVKDLVANHFNGDNALFLEAALNSVVPNKVASASESIQWTDEQRDLINNALVLKNQDMGQLVRDTVLTRAAEIIKQHATIQDNDGCIQRSNAKGFAEYRITQCFEAIQRYNLQCESVLDRWFVNYSLLYALTRCNTQALKSWMKVNTLTIDEHHKLVGLEDVPTSFNAKKKLTLDGVVQNGSQVMPSRGSDEYEPWLDNMRLTLGVSRVVEKV